MAEPKRRTTIEPPPRPRWVKVLGIALVVIVVVVVAVALLGGGDHGPGRHGGGGGAEHTSPEQHAP